MTLSRAWRVAWCQVIAADPSFHGPIYVSWPSWPLLYPSTWLLCLHSLAILNKQKTLAHLCNFQERLLNIEMFVNLLFPTCFNGVLGFGNQSSSWVILGTSLGFSISLCKRSWSRAEFLKLSVTKDIIWYNNWSQTPWYKKLRAMSYLQCLAQNQCLVDICCWDWSLQNFLKLGSHSYSSPTIQVPTSFRHMVPGSAKSPHGYC